MTRFKEILPKVLPTGAALLLFFIVSALYFAPQFRGEVLPQHDVQQYEGMAKEIWDNRAQTGEDPQWAGRMFGGMPAYLINVAYPAQLVKNTAGQIVKIINTPAAFVFFAMVSMWLMYLFFCFTVPCAFSLYYVVSNILMTVQSIFMKKIYDPEKMKEEVLAEMAARKKEQKRGVKNTTIKVIDEKTGQTVEKNISASEMNKRRLEYARKLDEERYKDERTVPLSELNKKEEE